MNVNGSILIRGSQLLLGCLLWGAMTVQAFPPAPPHSIFGTVRAENGEPLAQTSIQIVLETTEGVTVTGNINPNQEPGVNYRLSIPMDAGETPDPYIANALSPDTPFFITVLIGTTSYLPIEMTGDLSLLGEPSEETRIDLTLGVDSDGDGLPDSWENQLIARLGGGLTLEDITPDGDSDNDGLNNRDEYLAGTYAFDDQDSFKLVLKEIRPDAVVFEFLAIRGRFYEVQRTLDHINWSTAPFTIPAESAELIDGYPADDVSIIEVVVPHDTEDVSRYSYRGVIQ